MSGMKPRSIQKTLIVAIIIITVLPTTIISIYYYNNIVDEIKIKTVESIYSDLVLLTGSIDKQISSVEQLSNTVSYDRSVSKLIEISQNYGVSDIQQNILTNSISMGLYPYISFVSIVGNNGVQIVVGHKSLDEYNAAQKLSIKDEQSNRTNRIREKIHVFKPPYPYGPVLSYEKPLIHSYKSEIIGRIVVYLKRKFLSDVFADYVIEEDDYYFIVDHAGNLVFHKDNNITEQAWSEQRYVDTILSARNGYFTATINGENKLIIFNHSSETNWTLAEVVSLDQIISKQNRVVFQLLVIVFVSCIILITIFIFYFSKNLTKPLRNLLYRIRRISEGDLSYDSNIHVDNELGMIGKGLNKMSLRLKEYMDHEVEQEKIKRDMEFKVLQSQINPHFLYNTFNSIKWMADIRNTEGVKKMVGALGDLIRNISSVPTEKITLRNEIPLIEGYIYIQNIRYKGKIKLEVNIEDESILDTKILKFILQPIVENGIFHGIEAKKGIGHITISMREVVGNLEICVEDDGVGMSINKIKELLMEDDSNEVRGISGIAFKNIDERLKIVYGKQFGLNIESEEGCYTRVYIRIPIETDL